MAIKDGVRDADGNPIVSEPENQDDKKNDAENNEKDVVKYETYQRTIKQLKRIKEEKKELEDRLNQSEKDRQERAEKLREAKERELEKNGEYKKLLELKEKELGEIKDRLEGVTKDKMEADKTITDTIKLHAFYDKIPGKIKKREYLNFVDLDNIVVNPESGEIDPASVDNVVNKFMESYSELVDTSHLGRLPGGTPASGDDVSYSNWRGMSVKDMKKNLKIAIQKRTGS